MSYGLLPWILKFAVLLGAAISGLVALGPQFLGGWITVSGRARRATTWGGVLAMALWVPEHISVVGFDDIPFARYLTLPLTTASVPSAELGRHTSQRMWDLLNNRPPGHAIFLRPRIEIRGSAGAGARHRGRSLTNSFPGQASRWEVKTAGRLRVNPLRSRVDIYVRP